MQDRGLLDFFSSQLFIFLQKLGETLCYPMLNSRLCSLTVVLSYCLRALLVVHRESKAHSGGKSAKLNSILEVGIAFL